MTMTTNNSNGSTHESFARVINIADRLACKLENIIIKADQGHEESRMIKASFDRAQHRRELGLI